MLISSFLSWSRHINTLSLLHLVHTSRFPQTQHPKQPPKNEGTVETAVLKRLPGKQSTISFCRSGHCFCCVSKDAYFSSPYHVAKEVIITKCYAVKGQPYIKCMSFFDPAEPDDSYFAVKRANDKRPANTATFYLGVCQLRTDAGAGSNWRLKKLFHLFGIQM